MLLAVIQLGKKKGPIKKFVKNIANLKVGVHDLCFWDQNGIDHKFSNHDEFVSICTRIPDIKKLLSEECENEEQKELLAVLKAIERAFILSSEKEPEQEKLIFPINDQHYFVSCMV